jgi:alginate O-acetyltransferase complex protein AlgI
MLMVGLWHGTTWTFALWGLYHASLLAGYHVLQMIHGVRRIRVPVLLARVGMFASVTLGWALFRAHSPAAGGSMLAALVGLQGRGSLAVALNQAGRSLPLIVAFALVLTQLVPEPYEVHVRPAPWAAVALGVLFAISFASMAGSNPFLYLQF